jgi:outer membrane protein OmpA-like peptidoglycan-associated protein
MKHLKYSFTLIITAIFVLSMISATEPGEKTGDLQEEELVIPPDAQKKAIQAVKALGPERGAKKIDYKVVNILGIVKGIEAKSEKIEAALKDLGAKETETEFRIALSGDILFNFDKWNIRSEAEKTLKKVAEVVNASGSSQVVIAGHTDSKGSEPYNQRLSEKRAESVKNWLITNGAVDAKIMNTIGYGESKPVAPNMNPDGSDNPEGRQKNRRVEITVKKK